MKKGIFSVILVFLTLASFVGFLVLCYMANEINTSNKNLVKEIDEVKEKTTKVNSENDSYEQQITSLREEYKENLEELEIWQKTKEKLEKALS